MRWNGVPRRTAEMARLPSPTLVHHEQEDAGDKAQATRIGAVLRSGGWERHRRRVASGDRVYVWVPPRALRERAAAANAARAN